MTQVRIPSLLCLRSVTLYTEHDLFATVELSYNVTLEMDHEKGGVIIKECPSRGKKPRKSH